MNIAMTKKDLATLAGYTYRRLHEIDIALPDNKKLFVPSEDGKYDPVRFVQRWVAYNVETERGADDALDKVKAKHELVKTQKTELEVARMRGQLVDVEDIKRLWPDVAKTVTQSFLQLPSKVAPTLLMTGSVEVIAGILDEEIRSILTQIAETPLPAHLTQEPAGGADEDDEDTGG